MALFCFGSMARGHLVMKKPFAAPRHSISVPRLSSGLGNQVSMTALQSFAEPEHIATIAGVILSRLPSPHLFDCILTQVY
jgi:hypothetical protein